MKSLKRLDLCGTSIRELPSSAKRYLTNLEQLTLRACNKLKRVACNIFDLQHLRLLDISHCHKLVTFPTKSEFSTESASLQDTHYAPLFVNLEFCDNLVEIADIPREIYRLDTFLCPRLKRILKLTDSLEGKDSRMIPRMSLLGRNQLASEVVKMKKSLLDNSDSTALFFLFFSCRQLKYQVIFDMTDIPEWFTCRMDVNNRGHQVCNFKIDFPGNFKWEDKGLAFCALTVRQCPHFRVFRIYINGVCIIEASDKGEGCWLRCDPFVWLYYMPFDAIIKRLSESGLPPPSICFVKFESHLESMNLKYDWIRSCGVHVVMPQDEGPFVHQLLDNEG
ncbi:hypothetical protein ACLB2K_021270 [Fragaria x ananassa]